MANEEATAEGEEAPPQSQSAAVIVEELPRSIVRKVVKENLSQLGSSRGEADVTLHKEALLAFSESARVFIHYLSATANDICQEYKRQTINADDVLKALEEIEFPEFIGPLRSCLEDYRKKNAEKKPATGVKRTDKKRKIEEQPVQNGEAALDSLGGEEDAQNDTGGQDGLE